MDEEKRDELIAKIKTMLLKNYTLSDFSDDDLQDEIGTILINETKGNYLSIEEQVQIISRVYSSIRGLGLLDSIMNDDNITEVMINGADNIFIEKSGKLIKLNEKFESERRLEDIIQRIVGMAGREVNQASPIVDTRLPDGSRVNVATYIIMWSYCHN